MFQRSANANVSDVQRWVASQVENRAGGAIGCHESPQGGANRTWTLGCSKPAEVASNSFILWETHDDRTIFAQRRRVAVPKLDNLAATQIIRSANKVGGGSGRFKPGKPRGRV